MNTSTVGRAVLVGTTLLFSGTNPVSVGSPEILRVKEFANIAPGLVEFVNVGGTSLLASSRAEAQSISAQEDSRWIHYVSRRLAQLRRGEGDFTGLQQPAADVIERARELSRSLFRSDTPAPSVVPSEDGEVRFFWHKAGWMLEIAVSLEEVAIWAHQPSSGEEWSGSLADFRAQVSGLLDTLAKA